jgi:hypothetical protein
MPSSSGYIPTARLGRRTEPQPPRLAAAHLHLGLLGGTAVPRKPLVAAGDRFGRWIVLSSVQFGSNALWLCRCDCGVEKPVRQLSLRQGMSRSCGCLTRESSSRRFTTHGLSRSHEYGVWRAMLRRCSLTHDPGYADYGGRGIAVCERWQSFANFIADMGSRPSNGHSIERRDNGGNYEPMNCYWATADQQTRNTRRNLVITAFGRTKILMDWARDVGIPYGTLRSRIRKNWPPEIALTKLTSRSAAR